MTAGLRGDGRIMVLLGRSEATGERSEHFWGGAE